MQRDNDSATLAYIRHVIREMGISATALAKIAGVSSTTLTRPLNNSEYKFNLSATTIEKIAAVSGINPGPFFNNKDFASVSLASAHDKDAYDPKIWGTTALDHIESALIIGRAASGFWQEIGKIEDFYGSLFLTSPGYAAKDCFAVQVADGHAAELAFPGDFLFCIRYDAYKRELVTGHSVLVERRKEGGRLIELTARRLQKTKRGWLLTTYMKGRLNSDQLTIAELPGSEEASVIGVIEYGVRQPV
jgi:transcriptional regulator with XRE-family HTH domain